MECISRKKQWEDFMAIGRIPKGLRHDVLESWKRSARHQVADLTRAPIFNEKELENRRVQSRRLRRAAQTALNQASSLLVGTHDILLLCDEAGVVIDTVGDPHTLAQAQENHLHNGGHWIEEAIGTNAIGTALHLGLPTLIQGAEHFCEAIQCWNCAATPITEPGTGRILGVLDISWPGTISQPNTVALSSALALQIETELTRMLAHERGSLLELFHTQRLRRNDPILIMDRSGTNVFSTEDFARFFDDTVALDQLQKHLPKLIDQPAAQIGEVLSEYLHGADCEVISERNEAIGVLIASRRSRPQIRNWAATELSQISRVGEVSAQLCKQAQRLADTKISILIEGETGTGKSSLAKAIHHASHKSRQAFEIIDCAQLTEETLRKDLASGRYRFGGGTLCLNNPGAASLSLQNLLLVLADQVVEQEGKIIALSTNSLYEEMKEGKFDNYLYYRIAGARLHIPPLRDRPEEIIPLLRQLVQKHAGETRRRELRFTSAAADTLRNYTWPGNLLEMRNMIVSLDALSSTGLIDEHTLPKEFRKPARQNRGETLREVERTEILNALETEDGNVSRVAKRLGIARSTLYLKLDSYGISRPQKG